MIANASDLHLMLFENYFQKKTGEIILFKRLILRHSFLKQSLTTLILKSYFTSSGAEVMWSTKPSNLILPLLQREQQGIRFQPASAAVQPESSCKRALVAEPPLT